MLVSRPIRPALVSWIRRSLGRALLLAGLLVASAAAARPSASASPDQEASAPRAGDVSKAIDRGLHWLRSQQDPEHGGYGGVLGTAWVLRAFLESPREYLVSEGPFLTGALGFLAASQREDGAIADPGSGRALALRQSWAAAQALVQIGEEPALSATSRVLSYLDLSRGELAEERASAAPMDLAAARARAQALIAQLSAEHTDGLDGPLVETARTLVALSACQRVLAAAEPKPAKPTTTQALPPLAASDREKIEKALLRGALFLLESGEPGGLWGAGGRVDPGITALVAGALQTVRGPRDAALQGRIDQALAYLRSLEKPDGSIHAGSLPNYVTSAAIVALKRAAGAQNEAVVARAREFLRALQADEGEGYGRGDIYYGGIGYGDDERPDMSNLQLALEALAAAGLEPGDETFQKALVFLQRSQNRSESNDSSRVVAGQTVRAGEDGGGYYQPGDSKAGFVELPDGTKLPRSYGSMTYALLRGYLFAGLSKEDPRLEAAYDWLRQNYTLDQNPGFVAAEDPSAPYQGLFYYLNSMAKALDLYGSDTLVDAAGQSHSWRGELSGRLLAMQRPDGSWVNQNSPRWWEGNPVLATAYALLALDACLPAGERATVGG